VRASTAVMFARVRDGAAPRDVLAELAGVDDLTADELRSLDDAGEDEASLRRALAEAVSRRARLGWSTGGHTAVDVLVHALGPGSHRFAGHRDNTDVAVELADLLGLALDPSVEDGTR